MGIRESINQNKPVASILMVVITGIALYFILSSVFGGGGGASVSGGGKAFYSTDDGKTWFADDVNKVPPFDKDGKPAVLAYVYTCDGGKTKFVGSLRRYTPEAAKKLTEIRANPNASDPSTFEVISMQGEEVRKPGDPANKWVNQTRDYAGWARVVNVTCPDGKPDNLEPVFP